MLAAEILDGWLTNPQNVHIFFLFGSSGGQESRQDRERKRPAPGGTLGLLPVAPS